GPTHSSTRCCTRSMPTTHERRVPSPRRPVHPCSSTPRGPACRRRPRYCAATLISRADDRYARPMSNIDDIERAVALFREQSAGITRAGLGPATPCEGWDARRLIGHVVGIYAATADALHGERVDLVAAQANVADAPDRSIADAGDRMMAAWREPGALDRTLATT